MNGAFKVGFISLGCPKNQIDTEIMLKILADNGYEIVTEEILADAVIINTCAFIESAKQEAIDNILDVAWLKTNGKKQLKGIIVCGCLAQRYGEQILSELPEVDALIGVFSIHDILKAVRYIENKSSSDNSDHSDKYVSIGPCDGFVPGGERILTTPEYTAYIKIAEGCDNCCSYCVIPSIRGGFLAREAGDIIKEARELADIGVKELCVVAQDTTRYDNLPGLLSGLCEIEEIKWIRLLYCYPDKITDELIETIKNFDKIVKYIDMPIQHINDGILSAMNRPGGAAAVKSAVARLRESIPNITIRTTVIVGFPGETKEIFGELCEFLKETKFERLGAFAYSAEEGTPAAGFEGQVGEKEKQHRQKTVMAIQKRINYALNQKKTGRTLEVLCEGFDKVSEVYYGRDCSNAPEIDGKVYFTSRTRVEEGDFADVKIEKVLDYDLYGKCGG
ncbi:MAG: 30S ribosomal protein S12 methylthiotransferase RimO [Oscillospiraceae bacterium]|nr:30S ribosomal protein S12 methylthiotransferase RimO [Oscillospiraceae bacterium]